MSEGLIAALRKAADWGEDEFDVLSPQDAAAAADRIEALERELAELKEALVNPNAIHVSMLRGTIAKPSLAQIIHIYGSQALADELVIRGAAIRSGDAA